MGNLVKLATYHPPVAGTPPSGGTAPHPPYCIDVDVASPVSGGGYFIFIVDSLGNVVGITYLAPFADVLHHTEHRCFPASAGSPASPGSAGSPGLPPDRHEGWSGAGTSIASLGDHNGHYTFTIPGGAVGVVTGFNTVNEGAGYAEINYAIYAHSGLYEIMENGVSMKGPVAFSSDDVFKIERSSGSVQYYVNDVFVYRSGVPCFESLFVDASLYLADDSVNDADLVDDGETAGPTATAMVIGPLIGYASPTGGPDTHSLLRGLVGTAESDDYPPTAGCDGILGGLVGESYSFGGKTFTSGRLGGLVGDSEGDSLSPPSNGVDANLQVLQGFAVGINTSIDAGLVHGVLGPMRNYASTYNYHEVVGILTPLDLRGGVVTTHGELIDGYNPSYLMLGIAHAGTPVGLRGELSGYSFRAYGGASTAAPADLPTPTFVGSGTATVLGRLRATAPHPYGFTGLATTTIPGQMHAVYRGVYSLVAYGGGTFVATGPVGSFLGSATVGGVGGLRAVGPRMSLVASGTVNNFGGARGVLRNLAPGVSGVLVATGPHYAFRGAGEEEVTVEYEGYSMTLTPTEEGNEAVWTTHYTNFPFDRIVRFGNKHYGVAPDGLYELGGDTWDGAPIVATFQLAEQDHGRPELKRGGGVYLSGRVSADMDVTVITDERDSNRYKYKPEFTGAGTARVLIGKGIRAHYWAYEFTNTKGEDFALDNVTPLLAVTKRNINA